MCALALHHKSLADGGTSFARYTGVLETARIRASGFAIRIPFADFVRSFRVIAFEMTQTVPHTKETCAAILKMANAKRYVPRFKMPCFKGDCGNNMAIALLQKNSFSPFHSVD